MKMKFWKINIEWPFWAICLILFPNDIWLLADWLYDQAYYVCLQKSNWPAFTDSPMNAYSMFVHWPRIGGCVQLVTATGSTKNH
jgi:hypothetical protein